MEEPIELAVRYHSRVGKKENWMCALCEIRSGFVHGEDTPSSPESEGWIQIERIVPRPSDNRMYLRHLLVCPECVTAVNSAKGGG